MEGGDQAAKAGAVDHLDVSQIKYVEVADTSDLNDLPLFDPEALTQSPDEEPPTAPEVPC